MKTLSYNVYSFAELDAKAQARAIDEHRIFVSQDWDGETTIEDAEQCLAFAGFIVDKVHYSGFSSQGDGACFTGSWSAAAVDPAGMKGHAPIDKELHRIADELTVLAARFPFASFTVKQSGHYSHEYCTEFSFSLVDENGDELPDVDDAEKQLIELSRDAMCWIYRQLEKGYEWCMADEQVRDSIEANEYDFTQAGHIAPNL